MKTILIITSSIDYTVDYLIKGYNERCRFIRLNVDLFDKYQIELTGDGDWLIRTNLWCIKKSDIYSIYYRKPKLPNLSGYEDKYRYMIQRDIIAVINGLVDSFEGIVLTKPSVLKITENKIFQLEQSTVIGFNIPKSLITNNKIDAQTFINSNKSIIKPLTTGKILYNNECEIFQTNVIEDIYDDIDLTPIYLQHYVNKKFEVRLTVINEIFFGVKIVSSNAIDWRDENAANKYCKIDIPEDIKIKCRRMMHKFELNFGAFDFIVNSNDEWIFLEVNPNGQWLWLEEILDLNISSELLNFLVGEGK